VNEPNRRTPLAALFAMALIYACGGPGKLPQPGSRGGTDGGSRLTGLSSADSGCAREGCPCDDGSDPITCYLPPIVGADGMHLCAQGARYCRESRWTACESLLDVVMADGGVADAGALSTSEDPIISAASTCNPCHPDCFAAIDRPVAVDLDGGNSQNVSYSPDAGGLGLALEPTAPTVNPSTLVGSWTFNEGSGTTTADKSTRNRPITLTSTSWVSSTGQLATAGYFTGGSPSSGSTATSVVDTARSFTVSAWVRLDSLSNWRTFVNQDGVNVSGFWLQYNQWVGNKFLLTMHDADSAASVAYRATSTTTPVVGQWYHVVGVRDKPNGMMYLYVNGVMEGSTAYTGGWASNGALNVGRGKWGGPTDWFAGSIDEVKVFSAALSAAEVQVLYNKGTPVTTLSVCGNSVLEGAEQCDDANIVSADGCSASCTVEAGFSCTTAGAACVRSVCGNGVQEGLEQCDDGNRLIGDGCTFLCTREPTCASGQACSSVCGDGQIFPGEACDDGNARNGDGCSATCTLEPGFKCVTSSNTPPPYIDLPIVYRDFAGLGLATASGVPYRHPDFENNAWCPTTGMVQSSWQTNSQLATYKKPVASSPLKTPALTSAAQLGQWYVDDPTVNRTFADTLRVTRQGDGTYVFDSSAFFPLDGKAGTWPALGRESLWANHNFGFTSETRFWFTYTPPQTLSFRGDDDVWVFINGKLAVDIGGVHSPLDGSVTLDASTAAGFNLVPGNLYEAAVFQAERHTDGSNYRLTLANFVTNRTSCSSICGDGLVTSSEACDDGVLNGTFGACRADCSARTVRFAPSGSYFRDYAAGATCEIPPQRPLWRTLDWTAITLGSGSIAFKLQPSETESGLATAPSVTVPITALSGGLDVRATLADAGLRYDPPYLRVTAIITAGTNQLTSPVLQQFDIHYICTNSE
jgi:fibro-slime domain-containing protein